jgi:hypothetical protein
MATGEAPTSTDVLRSLRLLRSEDAEERRRAIRVLSTMVDDPRVLQVFEYLYQIDPDPGVRELTWQAISQAGPSIPAPGPGNHSGQSNPARFRRETNTGTSAFLLNPTNDRFVAREARRQARQPGGGRVALWLAGVLLLVASVLWALTVPDWITWYRLREDGIEITGTISDLQVRDGQYFVLYRFEPGQAGVIFAGEQRVSKTTYESITTDMLPVVIYFPDDPAISRLDVFNPEDTMRDRLTIIAAGLTGLLVLLVIVGLVQRLTGPDRDRQVIRGQVVRCAGYRDEDGDYNLKLSYRFVSPSGQTITAQTAQIRNDLRNKALPPPGTPVAVYYLSDRSYLLL